MMFTAAQQEQYIRMAMEQAGKSINAGGTPFGAVLISKDGAIIAAARSTVTPDTDILHHAELNLIREAHQQTGQQKFPDCAAFINAASCAMCTAALIQAGIRNFYYGAPFEPHTNPALSYEQIAQFCIEPISVTGDICAAACTAQIENGRGLSDVTQRGQG